MKKLTKAQQKKNLRLEAKKLDKAWATTVKDLANWKCAIPGCKVEKRLNAHHIIPREIKTFRWDYDNGLCLCPKHHRFSFQFSAHQNPFTFMLWFKGDRPEQYLRILDKWISYLSNIKNEISKDSTI